MSFKVEFEVRLYDWDDDKTLNFGLPNPVENLDLAKAKVLEIMDSLTEMFGSISYEGLEEVKPECWNCDGKYECNRHDYKMLVCQAEGFIPDEDEELIAGEYSIKVYENLR